MGLPDSSQPITIVIVGVMMAIRWLEAHVRENNRQGAPTREQLRKLDCLKDLDLFETSELSGKEKAEMLKEDLERNVTLYLHNSFCRNRESNVDPLPCCKQRVEEQKCWRTASNSIRIANDVLQDTETESAEEEEMEH